MNRVLAVLVLALLSLVALSARVNAEGQDGPGQSVKVGTLPSHPITPSPIPFGQDGPGQ